VFSAFFVRDIPDLVTHRPVLSLSKYADAEIQRRKKQEIEDERQQKMWQIIKFIQQPLYTDY
jgi:hypothetical protein